MSDSQAHAIITELFSLYLTLVIDGWGKMWKFPWGSRFLDFLLSSVTHRTCLRGAGMVKVLHRCVLGDGMDEGRGRGDRCLVSYQLWASAPSVLFPENSCSSLWISAQQGIFEGIELSYPCLSCKFLSYYTTLNIYPRWSPVFYIE